MSPDAAGDRVRIRGESRDHLLQEALACAGDTDRGGEYDGLATDGFAESARGLEIETVTRRCASGEIIR